MVSTQHPGGTPHAEVSKLQSALHASFPPAPTPTAVSQVAPPRSFPSQNSVPLRIPSPHAGADLGST